MSFSTVAVVSWNGPWTVTCKGARAPCGAVRVVGDVRLDDEADLARELGVAGARGLDLVARAYERWGPAFAAHLLGDFAIAVIDPVAKIVVAARDAFGVRRLAYRRMSDGVAIASDVGALAALGAPAAELDRAAVSAFLVGEALPHEKTFFRTVSRVPPGHTLIARPSGYSLQRHFDPSFAEARRSRDDTLDAIRTAFRAAVAQRIRGEEPVLVHVSGGIDSSSIACVADDLRCSAPLHFVSARFRGADEARFVSAVDARLRSRIHVVDAEPTADMDDPIDLGHPARYPLAAMGSRIEELAARTGARTVLSGIGGDELFFERGVYRDLAARGRWATLVRETCRRDRYTTGSRRFYLRDALRSLVPPAIDDVIARTRPLRKARPPAWLRASAGPLRIEPDGGRDAGPFHSETQRFTWEWLTSPRLAATLEAEDRAAANAGLRMAYPFLDTRLAGVVLGAPYTHRVPGGRMKALLRDALGDALPEAVRERTTVTVFDSAIAIAVAKKLPRLREAIDGGPWRSDEWVDRAAARALLRRAEVDSRDEDLARTVWDIATLELWLRALG
ncbi:MAG: asnB [Labilithrix sp.]|nr:asnB [Labilithrix sp.]